MTKRINTIATVNADIFVIPNSAGKIENFIPFEDSLNEMKQICELNGYGEFDKNDPLIQVWVCDNKCENYQNHYPKFTAEGKTYRYNLTSFIPYSILKNVKEGETIDLDLPVTGFHINEDDTESSIDTVISFKLTAKQTSYRYRRFGNFEEVVERVV